MIGQIAKRCGKCPEQWLVDGGYNVQRGRFGCRDGLSSMKTPISEQKRPPQRRIGITPPAGEISNARRACAPLNLSNSENRLLHRL